MRLSSAATAAWRRAKTGLAKFRGAKPPEPVDLTVAYVEYSRSLPLDPNLVLYVAYSGAVMGCNPYAIFTELLNDPDFAHLQHVWVLDSRAEIERRRQEYASHPNVRFVSDGGREYVKALATATYLIQNTTFSAYFAKRPGQVYVNTWHSAGALKKMGFDLPDGHYGSRNALRNLLMADYIIAPNESKQAMFTDSFRLRGLYPGKLLGFGYPRDDTTLRTPREEAIGELQSRGVKVDPGKKIILYAPTWRGRLGEVRGGAEELDLVRDAIATGLATDEYQILIKPHQFHYSRLSQEQKLSGNYVPRQMDANRLLAAVDILISDYSSIFFDFLVTERPVLFYIPDLDEYTAERGVYLTVDELPGPATADAGDLAGWINDLPAAVASRAESYARMREALCSQEDGQAARRAVDVIFRNRPLAGVTDSLVDPSRKRVLFNAADLKSTGATEALLALVAALDPEKYDLSLSGIGPSAQSLRNAGRLGQTRVIARIGTPAATPWEQRGLRDVARRGLGGWRSRLLWSAATLRREWRRSFGEARFDIAIEFTRHPVRFGWMVWAQGQSKLVVWQHTDAPAELRGTAARPPARAKRTPEGLARLYRAADLVVVPSAELVESNRKAFPGATFRSAASLVNTERVERLMAQALAGQSGAAPGCIVAESEVDAEGSTRTLQFDDTPPAPDSGEPYRRFVAMGRLSPEKNYANLIAAFGEFLAGHPNSRLFIVGQGPSEAELKELAAGPEMAGRVCLTGQLHNPFTVLSRADCFVLPSVYEGCNLSVMEARLVGLPVILAGFRSAPSVSVPGGQYVTGFGVDELLTGLEAFAAGKVPVATFDVAAHNAAALAQWEQILDAL